MELRTEFRSAPEWQQWQQENQPSFDSWREEVVAAVRRNGLIEPISGRFLPSSAIGATSPADRATLPAGGMDAGGRALLLALAVLRGAFRAPAVHVAGGGPRMARIVAESFPVGHGTSSDADLPGQLAATASDVVLCAGDALGRAADLPDTLRAVARALRPGGALLASLPLAPATSSPPDAPQPGWRILDLCRDAGFAAPTLALVLSARCGITADPAPGVFVLSATRPPARPVALPRTWRWAARRIGQVAAILGHPRSGTTMLTAVLDAHPQITALYEPWNARRTPGAHGPARITTEQLVQEAEAQDAAARTMVVKETTAESDYIHCIDRLLRDVLPPISRRLVLLFRNPFHCFLSEIEARRRWWGEAGLEADQAAFDLWAARTLETTMQMLTLCQAHETAAVFYDACVSRPQETVFRLMAFLGLESTPAQHLTSTVPDRSKVRGDPSFTEDARDVTDASVAKRGAEFAAHAGRFAKSPYYPRIEGMAAVIKAFEAAGVLTADGADFARFTTALRMALQGLRVPASPAVIGR